MFQNLLYLHCLYVVYSLLCFYLFPAAYSPGSLLGALKLHLICNLSFFFFILFVCLTQTWSLFSVGLAASIMAAASAIGLLVSMVMAIIHGGRSLLTHCRFPDAIGYSSITNECPFDPTRIYVSVLVCAAHTEIKAWRGRDFFHSSWLFEQLIIVSAT